MASEKRHTLALKARVPNIDNLLSLKRQMTPLAEGSFRVNYGLLLDLLHVKVDAGAITTLAQFYDPPLRCFTFQDFQLSPTVEEYAKILGHNLKRQGLYLGSEEDPTIEAISQAIHLEIDEVISWVKVKKANYKGIPRKFLEDKARNLLIRKNWKAFNAILTLLIYGVVLFPNNDDLVDMSAIKVFMTGSPVTALLADLHLSLCAKHEKERGGMISCCTSLMQVWLMSHLPKKGAFWANSRWSDRLMALTEKDIVWYSREFDSTDILFSCGDFPNIPLVGTKGAINCNPVLSLRQMGYPMKGKPDDSLLKDFVIKEGAEDPILLKRIQKAWGQVHLKNKEKKNCIAEPSYTQWVKARVKIVKLPFDAITPTRPPIAEPVITVPIEVAEELKAQVTELQSKNEEWESKYLQALGEIKRLERDQEFKEEALQGSRKRLRESQDKTERFGDGLRSANDNLIAKDEEIAKLERSYGEIEKFGRLAFDAQRKWRLKYQDQELKTQAVKKQLHEEVLRSQELESLFLQEKTKQKHLQDNIQNLFGQRLRTYEEQIVKLNAELNELSASLARKEKDLDSVTGDAIGWRNDFARMAAFSNAVIAELPEKLACAEGALVFYKIPEGVKEFMEYCGEILNFYKKEVNLARNRMPN